MAARNPRAYSGIGDDTKYLNSPTLSTNGLISSLGKAQFKTRQVLHCRMGLVVSKFALANG